MFSVNTCVSSFVILSLYYFCEITQSFELRNVTSIRTSRQVRAEGCILPEHPSNGLWTIYKNTKNFYPNQIVPFGSVLQINCRPNFKLDGDATVVCIDGNWSSTFGQCLRTCSPRHSTAVMKVTCRYNDIMLQNCSEPLHGTLAYFQCADFYEDHGLDLHPVHVCSNGRWSYSLPECVPICGTRNVQEPTLIVNGTKAKKGDYPWQVALYNVSNQELLCGGTLINQRVIVTAAHCISNGEGIMYPKELYSVAVGKYYRQYNDLRDLNDAQFSTIADMFIPRQYRGEIQNYFGDIAILVTKGIFELSTRVQPICIDWGLNRQSVLDPRRISHGFVSGWGFTTEHKNPSHILKELEVPIITDKECLKRLAENYEKFLTDDKLCAGFFEKGTSVCKGDSGGGLVTPVQQGTTANRYYLVGVVSLSPQAPTAEGGCDSQNYALYTRVHYYVQNFILEKEVVYRPIYTEDKVDSFKPVVPKTTTTTTTEVYELSSSDCISPDLIKNGKWSVYASHIKQPQPGVPLADRSRLEISCDKGFALENPIEDNVIHCINRTWNPPVPRCLKLCEPLRSSISTEITCFNKDKKLPNCSTPVDGTIAKYKCAEYYEDPDLSKNPGRLCRDGSWDLEKSQCIPICGTQSISKYIVTQVGKYPWHVAIYHGDDKKFICNGVLISTKTVITTTTCLKNPKGGMYFKRNLTIAAGKVLSNYFEPEELTQLANVSDIWMPNYAQNYAHMAVVTIQTPFFLTYAVQPVCFDYTKNFINEASVIINHSKAYVSTYEQLESISSPYLQGREMHIKSTADCFSKNETAFSDSFCASYSNQSFAKCRSDDGAPLVVKINETDRFYLAGIGSIFNDKEECNPGYAYFTKVWYYAYEIFRKELESRRFNSVFGFN